MEVLRKNFRETLPLISASIKKADFLVIDAEFTGLINGKEVSIFDTPEDYYRCLLHGSTEFILIQYGLCAFYWNEEENHYMNDAYNFYLFPRGKPGPEKMFLCQSSSLDFLASQGFDFNKLIREGISYMTEPNETRLRENLIERQKTYSKERDAITIPDEHKPFVEQMCKKVRDFIDENKLDEMEIDRCNAFVRLLLFQELKIRFKHKVLVETKILENKNRILNVIRVKSKDDLKNHDTQRIEKEWEEFEDAVGFSKVARMISKSEKLVIGHNMLLDILHTLNNFFHPLPGDYLSFKEFAHCMFPNLLDTKYMSSLPPFKDRLNSSVLQHLFVSLSEAPFSLPKVESLEGRGYSHADEKHHEAGYDAYVTGMCFLAMYEHVARMRGEGAVRVGAPHHPALRPFINKLFLAKTAHQDSPYMNLAGAEPSPSRDHVFHLTFPKEWQRNDINQLFSPFGPITVQFLEETSALVALSRRDQARVVTRALARHARVTLVPYLTYKDKMALQPTGEHKHQVKIINPPECKAQQASSVEPVQSPRQQLPEKIPRDRSNSVTLPEVVPPARKRTSSGVFQVDEAEPPPKKNEPARSNSEGSRTRPEVVQNGRRKLSETTEKDIIKEKKKEKAIDKKVIEVFDSAATQKCVTAFKESESWD